MGLTNYWINLFKFKYSIYILPVKNTIRMHHMRVSVYSASKSGSTHMNQTIKTCGDWTIRKKHSQKLFRKLVSFGWTAILETSPFSDASSDVRLFSFSSIFANCSRAKLDKTTVNNINNNNSLTPAEEVILFVNSVYIFSYNISLWDLVALTTDLVLMNEATITSHLFKSDSFVLRIV